MSVRDSHGGEELAEEGAVSLVAIDSSVVNWLLNGAPDLNGGLVFC